MTTHYPETFGAILRRHRRAVGLSQEELAERSGLSVRRIGELERRPRTQPHRETVRLLAEALDLSEEDRAQLEIAAQTMRRSVSPPVGVAAPDPFPRAAGYEHNLPLQPTSFIGRERGADAVRAMLLRQDVRLLTLTGPGGAGKTRLAIRVAESVIGRFRNGVWFVDLAPIASPEFVASAAARALGVKEVPGQPLETILSNHLRDKQLLLVLDNFEQILGAAPMIAELLSGAPRLKVLVTSRAVLHLRAEQVYQVPPLELPHRELPSSHEDLKECEAVRLFIERARAAGVDSTFDGEDATAVAEICMRLEGLPLAIELAAARTRALPPKALLSRLDRRLDLLTGGPRDAPDRHRTVRATIEWSNGLLGEEERRLLASVGVFAGGFSLTAAETLCCADLDVIAGVESLVAASLVKRQEIAGLEPRFAMLETIREYALEQMEQKLDGDAIRREHAKYFLALAEAAREESETNRQRGRLRCLDAEIENLRAALSWTLGRGDPEAGLRLAGALSWFWEVRGHLAEGREWLERALAVAGTAPVSVRARALAGLASIEHIQGDFARAVPLAEESLAVYRQLGDERAMARALLRLAWILLHRGDAVTLPLFEESLQQCRELGDKVGISTALMGIGRIAVLEHDLERGARLRDEALTLARTVGDEWLIARGAYGVAWTALALGERGKARAHYAESLHFLIGTNDRWGIAVVLEGLAAVAAGDGEVVRAAQLTGAASAIRDEIGADNLSTDRSHTQRLLDAARERLGERRWKAAREEGRAMPRDRILVIALDTDVCI